MPGIMAGLNVNYGALINTRMTAVGVTPDYTAIGASAGAVTHGYGRVVITIPHHGVVLVNNPAPAAGGAGWNHWCNNLPAAAPADYQQLAFVIVTPPGAANPIGVGFLHNIYAVNDNRSAMLQRLADAADLIRTNAPLNAGSTVYVCGDFNAVPQQRQNGAGTIMTPLWQGTTTWHVNGNPQAQLLAPQVAAGGQTGGTTMAGSLYDYSFVSAYVGQGAMIDTRTMEFNHNGAIPGMTGLMSDHVASMLQV